MKAKETSDTLTFWYLNGFINTTTNNKTKAMDNNNADSASTQTM